MKRLDLSGEWQLRQVGAADGDAIKATIPGDTHSALLAAGKIDDPYWGANELDVQWIGQRDWAYLRTFTVNDALLAEASICLAVETLDTLGTVYLNDQRVGTTANMFARYRFEVKPFLKAGENVIRIVIASAENEALALSKQLPYEIPHGINPVQSMHRNLVRKVQCHSGWDWGCCLMVAGIYGEVALYATSEARIEYVYTEQRHTGGKVEVDVYAEVLAAAAVETAFAAALGEVEASRPVKLTAGYNRVKLTLTVENPKLWWPNGCGEQYLYTLNVSIGGDSRRQRLGLRTLDVVVEDDQIGRSMTFRVNGRDLFCKGANWIPCDALPQRQTSRALDELLTSAVAANMNMLRVWGGGQYESDAFYDLCDEKGLLIWQDFMFSCSLYPATADFLANVRREAEHQVKRLRDHACLALWCGNNENVGALNWFEQSRKNRDRYLIDYDRLTEGVLGQVVRVCDPTRTWWPSSPCGGPNDYSDCWHDDSRGDMHYWSVWHEGKSFDAYYKVTPRFCSEFGYQSFPSIDTIRTYAPKDQFNMTSPIMEHHQRNRAGNSKITEMVTRYFRVPEGFANFVYLSQVQQAIAIRTAVEYWRSLRPTCMGAIYWQLDDNWPVCSWSSLEYGGKWKLLHYAAKRFFANVLPVVLQLDDEKLEIRVVNDLPEKHQASFTLRVFDFAGKELRKEQWRSTLPEAGAKVMKSYAVKELAPRPAECFLHLAMEVNGETVVTEHFFTEYKRCNLAEAQVRAVCDQDGEGFKVTLSTDRPAFFVGLNADGLRGEFSDNCFGLLPGEPRVVRFYPKSGISLEQLQGKLTVNHLRATYG